MSDRTEEALQYLQAGGGAGWNMQVCVWTGEAVFSYRSVAAAGRHCLRAQTQSSASWAFTVSGREALARLAGQMPALQLHGSLKWPL